MLTIGAVWVGPSYLQASDGPTESTVMAADAEHQQVIELLGAVVSRSRGVVAVHERGNSPFTEMVLWLEDVDEPGTMAPTEIAVLTHSPLMRTIRLYTLVADDAPAEGDPLFDALPGEAKPAVRVDTSDIEKPSFCGRWRDRPDVQSKVIASGVDKAEFTVISAEEGGSRLLRISLTWPVDSTDGADEATIIVGVVLCTDRDGWKE